MGQTRQGKQKLCPTHQFPGKGQNTIQTYKQERPFLSQDKPQAVQQFALKRHTEAWKEIKGLEAVRKASNYPPAASPHAPFQATKCARHSVPPAALEGRPPYTLKGKGRVSRRDAKSEGGRRTRDSKQSHLSSQTPKRGLGAGDPFLPHSPPPHAPSDVKKKKKIQPKWWGQTDRLLRSWVPSQGPRTEEGMVAPPSRPLPPTTPGADWRALTLEARTRTQKSRDPPSARKRPSRPGLEPNRATK